MTEHKRNYKTGSFWGRFLIVLTFLGLMTFVLTMCDIRHFKWKSKTGKSPITSIIPTPTHNVSQLPIFPTKDEILDADGNNVQDMIQGDLNIPIVTASATMTKVLPKNTDIPALIEYGKKYMGRTYEYGSDRRTDITFDCSDAMQWFFKNTIGMQLPLDSRSQKAYVEQFGSHRWTDWRRATAGDLFFFTNYRGSKKENYADVERGITPITHVGLYIGKDENGKHLMLHTASASKGVTIDTIDDKHWEYRLVYNGRPF